MRKERRLTMSRGAARNQSEIRVRAVERVLDVLSCLAAGEQTLTEVARTVGLNKATTLRLLAGLSYRYFVIRDPHTGRYGLGPGATLFMDRAQRFGADAHGTARQHLRYLAETTGETSTLHMRLDQDRICIAEVESRQYIKYVSGVGRAAPIHLGSAGKMLLGALPEEECRRVVAGLDLGAAARAELLATLKRVRAQGYATSLSEWISGASSISVPVYSVLGVDLLVLSVLGPSPRLPVERLLAFLPLLQSAAGQMEQGVFVPAPTGLQL